MIEPPATLAELLAMMTPEIHAQMRDAIALGRWENGDKLTDEQRSLCLQAVIAYDEKFLPPEQRVGYVKSKEKECHN